MFGAALSRRPPERKERVQDGRTPKDQADLFASRDQTIYNHKAMRIGYLECFSGISGDMLLGALVDAGVPFDVLAETAAALNVGARLEMRKVSRGGLAAMKVDVVTEEQGAKEQGTRDQRPETHAHEHTHACACAPRASARIIDRTCA